VNHKLITTILIIAIVFAAGIFITDRQQDQEANKVRHDKSETIINYIEIDGAPVWLIYNDEFKIVTLQTTSQYLVSHDNSEIKRLAEEVVRLTTATDLVGLGETGFYFRYEGGFPLWELYRNFEGEQSLYLLNFAQHAWFDPSTNTIYARGDDSSRDEYNMYPPDLANKIAGAHGE